MRKVKFKEHTTLAKLGSFLRLDRFKIVHPMFNPGEMSDEMTLVNVHRGDAVAGILHVVGQDRQTLLLVEQFRMPTLIDADSGLPDLKKVDREKEHAGRMLELMAGMQQPGEPWLEAFRRECEEEIGFVPDHADFIGSFYPSPGACSEQIHLYYARFDWPENKDWPETEADDQRGRGVDNEDIRRHAVSPQEFLDMVADGRILDGKCYAAAEWMRRPENFGPKFGLETT